MARCGNCGTQLTCGCQKRTASDGRSVCANCKSSYEKSIQKKKAQQQKQDNLKKFTGDTTPGVISVNVYQH